ncbi:hypothetical protein IV203_006838 [Nitzschia inconspicua]|uniref:Uncharacterized protein n=1 Tax=Nitzschia inconspicua TaxID=303405 RepID=A0A9K3K8C9_9STRA|nr:hypothetical protein IV203_006838 [Nitzschia inconspicua]
MLDGFSFLISVSDDTSCRYFLFRKYSAGDNVSRESFLRHRCSSHCRPLLSIYSSIDDDSVETQSTALSSHPPLSRNEAIRKLSVALLSSAAVSMSSSPVRAFDKTFPTELAEGDKQSGTITLGQRSNSLQRKQAAEQARAQMNQNLVEFNVQNDLLPSVAWGLALWLLSGSRSNPLATPLANVIYDPKEEKWLQDRNAGLFASPPVPFLLLLGVVFVCLGTVTQFLLLQLAEGDSGVCGQLAGVALIGGGFFEIGRIASGEKRMTRDELDRAVELKKEFDEFASKRLILGGNCHRSDVVKAFRRFNPKYRQAESEQYPLTDLEIEKLLRAWNQRENDGKADMTSSGFYYGIQINKDADVFV